MNCKIDISKSVEKLAEKFSRVLKEEVSRAKDYYTIALSGGSTPKAIFKFLSENYAKQIDWEKIKFFWGDERCVPSIDSESNYKMTFDNLFNTVKIPEENIFRIHGENNPVDETKRYAEVILNNVASRNEQPAFNLVLLGLGEDGHTASIFPDRLELFSSDEICEVTEHPVTKQKRITLVGKVINNASKIIFLVTGESKKEMVDKIINRKDGYLKLPASFVNPNYGELIWMMDEAASSLLKPL